MSLESIRNSVKGPFGLVVIAVIFFSFAIWGISANIFLSNSTAVATVNGIEITPRELEQEVEASKRMFGNFFDQLYRTDEQVEQFRQGVLDQLINKKLLLVDAKELGARVSDDELKESIRAIPNFQVGGKFDQQTYLNLLAANGYSDEYFRKIQGDDLLRRQVQSIIGDTEIALNYEAALRYELDKQKRSGRYVEIKTNDFKEKVEITDSEIEAHYNENQEDYRVPEKVIVEYIELSQDKLKSKVEVSDEEAKTFYDDNSQDYVKVGPKKAAHILIISEDNDAEAKEQADKVYAELEAGKAFADLAKEFSMDEDSAEQGGDIGWQNKGDLEEGLDSALFALEVGAYSKPVKSEFGYHILTNLENGEDTAIAFEEVKAEIVDLIKTDKASEIYIEKQNIIAERAFEISDSLTEVATEVGIEVMTSDAFSKQGGTGLAANPVFAEAAFSDDVYNNAVNSEVIEISENHVAVLRLKEKQPTHIKELSKVSDSIKQKLVSAKALEKAKAVADEIMQNKANQDLVTKVVTDNGLEWKELKEVTRTSTGMPIYVRNDLFSASTASLPSTQLAAQGETAVAIVELSEVIAADAMADSDKESFKNEVKQNLNQSVFQQFVAQLKTTADISKEN